MAEHQVKVWNFVKPSYTATLNSNQLSYLISEVLNVPLVWNDAVWRDGPLDLLIIVNGPMAFSGNLADVAKAARTARRVVWVQHDYCAAPPKHTSKGQSPFRACWRKRHQDGLPDLDYWTTIKNMANQTPLSAYINWNAMAWAPRAEEDIVKDRKKSSRDLFYYGAYRRNRVVYFHRYFDDSPVPVTISGAKPEWKENWPHVNVLPVVAKQSFYQQLTRHGLGLYIEDACMHSIFQSPATRFFEMVSAGLPIVFQPEAVDMLKLARIDASPYVVHGPKDLIRMMRNREDIREEQHRQWSKNYLQELKNKVKLLYRKQIEVLS